MRGWAVAAGLALGLAGCNGFFGADNRDPGAVYTMTNAAAGNRVLVFTRAPNGHLTLRDSVDAGGRGSGPDPVFGTDPLGSQDAVVLSGDHRFLFVLNAGSNEISSFRVADSGALTPVNRIGSQGVFPVSLAVMGTLLYVVNAKAGGNVAGFRVAADGTLSALAGSVRPLSGAAEPGPGSIRISPDARTLVVTEKSTNLLDVYALGSDGLASSHTLVASPGPTPFGADFDLSGHYIVSLGNIGPGRAAVIDGSAAASLSFPNPGVANTITASAATTETAACWVQITDEGAHAYTSNTGSGSITGFRIASNGGLILLDPDGRSGVTGEHSQPLEMAYADGFLYVLTAGDRGVHVFRVSGTGALRTVADADQAGIFPESVTGLAAF